MAPRWIYEIDKRGLSVTAEFMDRIRDGDAAALRALQKVDLTTLYRRNYSRRRKWENPGFFWGEDDPIERIPIARGRNAPGPWVYDELWFKDRLIDERRLKKHIQSVKHESKKLKSRTAGTKPRRPKSMAPDQMMLFEGEMRVIEELEARGQRIERPPERSVGTKIKRTPERWVSMRPGVGAKWKGRPEPAGYTIEAHYMKVNPKFELVVVNKHDRAALLKLLSEIDTSPTVEAWLGERTERGGATLSSALFTDYEGWCNAKGEVALGRKAFAQALVANGIVKLTRSRGGERYEVELRPQPRSAGTSAG